MKTVLITGVTGLLGRTILIENKKPAVINIIGGFFPAKDFPTLEMLNKAYMLDIRDKSYIKKIVRENRIDVIVNCASIASVDFVEQNKELAYDINYIGTKNICDMCKEKNIKLIHISTNAVYDGKNPPYNEKSELNPINYYGKLKQQEEEYVEDTLEDFAIIRPILMYGWNDPLERENPLTWQLRLQREKKSLKIVDDIFCNPLLVNDCARFILRVITAEIKGIYNISGPEIMSRYDFSLQIADYTGYDKNKIEPVSNNYFKSIAPRPVNTSFDISLIQKQFNFNTKNVKKGLEYLRIKKI